MNRFIISIRRTIKMKEDDIKWHPAFYSALQLEFESDLNKLEFINEFQLSKEPLRIDVNIIKKIKDDMLSNEIGSIFRKYNLIEYKSPDDYLSIGDYYKVHDYGCLYQSLVETTEKLDISDITLTLCCKSKPIKLFKHLKEIRHFEVIEKSKGIYYVDGDFFPVQILLNTRLSTKQHLYLKSLDNKLVDISLVERIIKTDKNNDNYSALMHVIFRANLEVFKEVLKMSDSATLERIVNEIILDKGWDKEFFKKGEELGLKKGKIETAKKFLLMGLSIEQVAEGTDLTIDQVRDIQQGL